jgi:branched-chain amino acid transport system substrate-binding protein
VVNRSANVACILCAVIFLAAALFFGAAMPARAEQTLKLGVLTDLSSFGADVTGKASLTAVQMAIDDFGGTVLSEKIELVSADTQNRPDIAANLAREFLDQKHVNVLLDLPQSAVSLTVQKIAQEHHTIDIVTSGVTAELTGKSCSPYGVHWAEDTNALAAGTVGALVSSGVKKWYFVAADFAFGHTMEGAAQAVLARKGGVSVGTVWVPTSTMDYSSFIMTAAGTNADVVAFATVGNDFVASMKQAHEFGLAQSGKKIAGLITYLSDVHSLGLDIAQGLYVTSSFYWDQNDAARAFAARFEKIEGRKPNKTHASLYAATLHYLHAVKAANSSDSDAVIAAMKSMPADYFGKSVKIREDGRAIFDLDVYQVKTPAESKAPWDLYRKVNSEPGDELFAPLNKAACSFLH